MKVDKIIISRSNKMDNLEMAQKWFWGEGVKAYIDDGSLYIKVNELEIQVSSAEVSYRAELYKEEK